MKILSSLPELTYKVFSSVQKYTPYTVLGSVGSSLADFPWVAFFTGLFNVIGVAGYLTIKIRESINASNDKIKHRREAYRIWGVAQRRRARELPVDKLDPGSFFAEPDTDPNPIQSPHSP